MALKIQNLCLGYGRKRVLENLNVVFRKGVTCLLGRNGAGKSSLLRAIFGLVNAHGEIFHNGKIIDRAFIRDEISYIPQSAQAVSNISVFDVVLLGNVFSLRLMVAEEIKEKAESILSALGIRHLMHHPVSALSGGEKQMVFLAQALIKNPKVLLLDEPASSLDIYNQIKVMKMLRQLKDLIVIVAAHDLNLPIKFSDEIVLLNNCNVVYQGAPEFFDNALVEKIYQVKSHPVCENGVRGFLYTDIVDDAFPPIQRPFPRG